MSICEKLRYFKDLTLILRKASKIKERMQVDEGRIRNFDVTFDTDSCPLGVSTDSCPTGAPWLRA